MSLTTFPHVEQRSPGLYPGLDRKDLPPGLSYSGAKDILKSPFVYQWRRQQPYEPSDAMDLGTVLHSLVLDTGRSWETIDGGRGVTERKADVRARGLIPIRLEDLAKAARMAQAVADHAEASALLDRCGQRELAAIADDGSTTLRAFLDARHDAGRYVVELKSGRPGTIDDFARAAVNFGYDLQAATYHTIMEWLGQPVETVWFVIVESEPPHQVAVRCLDAEFVDLGRAKLRRALDTYARCVTTGEWPGPEPVAIVSAPRWAIRQEETA